MAFVKPALLMTDLETLLPLAIAWSHCQQETILSSGRLLSPAELSLADRVGVAYPERIRVLESTMFPLPNEPVLRVAAQQTGLFGPTYLA